jgi:hypothetical protein
MLMKYLLLCFLFFGSLPAVAQDNCIEIGSSAEFGVSISKTTGGIDTIVWIETDDPHFTIPEGRFPLPMMLSMGNTALIPLIFTPTEVKTYLANMIFHFSDSATFLAPIDGCGKAQSGVESEVAVRGMYPNPARVGDIVRFKTSDEVSSNLAVYSVFGGEIKRVNNVRGEISLLTDGWVPGEYECVIRSPESVAIARIMVVQ